MLLTSSLLKKVLLKTFSKIKVGGNPSDHLQVKLCEKLDKDSAKEVKVDSFPNAASTTYDPMESLSTDVSETWTAAGS